MIPRFIALVLTGLLGVVLAACTKKHQTAEVLSKEFRAAPQQQSTKEGHTAHHHEHWVRVRFIANGRTVDVPVDKDQWNSLKQGDRVEATYHEGNYTGTIWAIDVKK